MQRDEIFKQIKACVAEVLVIDEEELIQPHSSLAEDLGTESIDFVEIIHLLSRTFDIQIDRNEIYPDRDFLTDEKYITTDYSITDDGAEELITRWPHLNKEKTKGYEELITYLGTVSLLIDFLEYKLKGKSADV